MISKTTYVIKLAIVLAVVAALSGCAGGFKKEDPSDKADRLAFAGGFTKQRLQTTGFNFLSYQKVTALSAPLHIYIEGDGRSYLTRNKISNDPTPHQPLALKLALLDPHPNVVYLARPCQYPCRYDEQCRESNNEPSASSNAISNAINNAYCTPLIWSSLRFSEQIIAAMDQAVAMIKQKTKAKTLHLIGFSGGAAVAVLIAARRSDVASLRTVAGDLDHEQMSAYHKTTPLDPRSLNPKHYARKISHIPQHHFSGEKDRTVPLMIAESFVKASNQAPFFCARYTVVKGATHHDGFEKIWQSLLGEPMGCHSKSIK